MRVHVSVSLHNADSSSPKGNCIATLKNVDSKYVVNVSLGLFTQTHRHTDTKTDTETHRGRDNLHTCKDIHNESQLKPHTLNSGDYLYARHILWIFME